MQRHAARRSPSRRTWRSPSCAPRAAGSAAALTAARRARYAESLGAFRPGAGDAARRARRPALRRPAPGAGARDGGDRMRPRVLLLDEHAAALDPSTAERVMAGDAARRRRARLTHADGDAQHAARDPLRRSPADDGRGRASARRLGRGKGALDASRRWSSASTSPTTRCCSPDARSLASFWNLVPVTLVQGLLYGFVALGVMIPFRLLAFPDLTSEGSFPLGGCVCAALIVAGDESARRDACGLAAGMLAGSRPRSSTCAFASTRCSPASWS